MSRYLALPLSLLLLACATTATPNAQPTHADTPAATQPTSVASGLAFSLDTLDGRRLDLTDHLGKQVIFLSFWATYCEPCKSEMWHLQRFHERYADDGLAIISIAIDGPDTSAEVRPLVRREGYTYPVALDEDGAVTQALNPTASAPYGILIDRDGKIVLQMAGFQPSEAPALEAEIQRLLER